MTKSFEFCLEGCGYLEGIQYDCRKDKTYARIRMLQLPSTDVVKEEVTLDCDLKEPALFSIVQKLEEKRLAGQTIILNFRATFVGFGYCFDGLTPECPDHMLGLDCKLKVVEGWYQDGCWNSANQQKENEVLNAA